MDNQTCKNCGQPVSGKYCSDCGQSTATKRIDLHNLIHDFTHGVLHVDAGFFFTLKELTVRPGQAIHEYIAGKRNKYFKPFAYVFLLFTAYVMFFSFLKISPFYEHGMQAIPTGQTEELVAIQQIIEDWLKGHYSLISLLILPITAFCYVILFKKSKYNYGEYLVTCAYISGQQTALSILLLPFSYLIGNDSMLNLQITGCMLLGVYMQYSIFNVYRPFNRIIRIVGLILLSYIIVALLTIILIGTFLTIKLYLK